VFKLETEFKKIKKKLLNNKPIREKIKYFEKKKNLKKNKTQNRRKSSI